MDQHNVLRLKGIGDDDDDAGALFYHRQTHDRSPTKLVALHIGVSVAMAMDVRQNIYQFRSSLFDVFNLHKIA